MSEIIKADRDAAMEAVVMNGDLSRLNAGERVAFLVRVCESLGLNMLTRPFDYINLNGKLTLYARKDCTEQLRTKRNVSITRLDRDRSDDLYIVTATAVDGSGRTDVATGAVAIGNLRGEPLANAIMKAETKAKRRVTLSICGLGMLDESEIESIPGARVESVAEHTPALPAAKPEVVEGEVVEGSYADTKPESKHPPAKPQPEPRDEGLSNEALEELGSLFQKIDGKFRTVAEIRKQVNIRAVKLQVSPLAAMLKLREDAEKKIKEAAEKAEKEANA